MTPRKIKKATGASKHQLPTVTSVTSTREFNAPATPIKQSCALCGSRKLVTGYPVSKAKGTPILVTCNQCLDNINEKSRTDLLEAVEIEAPRPKRKREFSGRTAIPKRVKTVKPVQTAECRICSEFKRLNEFPKPTAKPRVPKLNKRYWMPPPPKPKVMDVPAECAEHLCARKTNQSGPICKECIGNSLAGSLSYKSADKVGCPDENCGNSWDAIEYVVKYLSAEDFTTYSEKLFKTYIATNKRMYYCINESCGAGALVEPTLSVNKGFPNMECVECKTRQCVNCKSTWHVDQTCQQYQLKNGDKRQSNAEYKVMRSLVKQGARRCTHCAYAVIKIDGCPNMFCK
jgi:hypothetical protein